MGYSQPQNDIRGRKRSEIVVASGSGDKIYYRKKDDLFDIFFSIDGIIFLASLGNIICSDFLGSGQKSRLCVSP